MSARTALRICPLCEATCGLTLTIDDGRVTARPRRPRRRLQRGLHLSQGRQLRRARRRPRPADAAPWCAATASWSRPRGTRRSPRSPTGSARSSASTAATAVGVVPRQPERAHHRGRRCTRRSVDRGAAAPAASSAPARSTRCPSTSPAAICSATPSPFPCPTSTAPTTWSSSAPTRWCPTAAWPPPPTSPASSGRCGGAAARLVVIDPHRTRTGRARRPPHRAPARHRRRTAVRDRARALRRGARRLSGGSAATSPASTRCERWPRTSRPRRSPRTAASPPSDIRTPRPRTRRGARAAAVYGRIGTSTVEFGTLASWLVDVLNALTGNLDRPGGAMFPLLRRRRRPPPARPGRGFAPAAGAAGCRATPRRWANCPPPRWPRRSTRPARADQRALITIAGNPVLSAPDGARLERALAGVDFMVQRRPLPQRDDPARRRHPAAAPARSRSAHFDFALCSLAVRNNARYSPPALPLATAGPTSREILSPAGADPRRAWGPTPTRRWWTTR